MAVLTQDIIDKALALQAQAQPQSAADYLAAQQAQYQATRGNTVGETLGNVPTQLLSGAVDLGQAAYGLANMGTLGVLDRATGLSQNFAQTQQILNSWQSAPTQRAGQQVDQAFQDQGIGAGLKAAATSPAYLQQALLRNIPSLLPGAATARFAAGTAAAEALAKGVGETAAQQAVQHAAERAVLTATGGQIAGQTNVDTVNAIRDAGGDANQQQAGALLAGGLAGVLGAGISKVTGAAGLEARVANLLPGGTGAPAAIGNALTTVAGAAVREGVDETGQSASQQMAENLVTPGKPIMAGVGQQAALGGALGALLGGTMGGVSVASARASAGTPLGSEIEQAAADANQDLGGVLTDNALSETSEASEQQTWVQKLAAQRAARDAANSPGPAPEAGSAVPSLLDTIDRVRNQQGTTPIVMPDGTVAAGENINLGDTPVPTEPAAAPEALPLADVQPVEDINLGDTPLPVDQNSINLGDTPVPGRDTPLYPPNTEPVAGLPEVTDLSNLTWKKRLAQELDVKPAALRGKVWDQLTAGADAAGLHPADPASDDYLRGAASQLMAQANNSTPAFVEKLAAKYPAQQADTAVSTTEQSSAEPEAAEPQATAEPVDQLAAAKQAVQEAFQRKQTLRGNKDYLGANLARTDELQAMRQVAVLGGESTAKLDKLIASQHQRNLEQAQALQQAQEVVAQTQAPVTPAQPATPGAPDFSNPTPISVDHIIRQSMKNDPTLSKGEATADAYVGAMMEDTNPDNLDATFMAVKNHTGWNTLTDAQKTDVANNFERLYARMTNDPGRFDRATEPGEKGAPIAAEDLSKLVDSANRNKPVNSPDVQAVDTVSQFEELTSTAAPSDARGVFTGDKIYLIRENLPDAKQVALTLAHERGHAGLSNLLGDRTQAVVNRLWTNPAIRKRIQAKVRELNLQGGVEQGSVRRLAGEEVLADMFAAGEKVSPDIITKARAAIEQGFAKVLGLSKMRMENSEVEALLRDVSAALNGAPAQVAQLGQNHPGLVDLMGDPAPWMTASAKFDRAGATLDQIVNDAANDGTRKPMSDVVKNGMQAAYQVVKSGGTGTIRDKIRSGLLDAMPLSQIASYYKGMFDGKLSTFARLKRLMESMHNKILTEKRPLSYGQSSVNTSAMETAQQWEKFRNANPAQGKALDALQQNATLYRLHPDRDLDAQSKLDYSQMNFTEAQREQAHRDNQRLWKSIGPDGQQIYKQSQAVYSDLWNRRFQALKETVAKSTGLTENMLNADGTEQLDANGQPIKSSDFRKAMNDRIDSALAKMQQGPYSPLKRYGDYLVTVRDKQGKVAWFSGHDTLEQAQKVRNELKTGDFAGDDYVVSQPTKRSEHVTQLDGISQNTISSIEKQLDGIVSLKGDENTQLREEVRQGLVEAYLQSLPQSAFLQQANTRKNVQGATTDAFRAYNDYAIKASRSIAGLTYNWDISRALADLQDHIKAKEQAGNTEPGELVKMGTVLNAVRRQHQASQNFERSKVADALTAGGFLWYMSSPSQLFMNATQVFMNTLPRMAADYGNAAGIKFVKQGLAAFAKSRGDLLGDKSVLAPDSFERKVLQELHDRGTLDFTLTHDMTGLANGDSSAMSGHWRKTMEVAGWAMQKSEVFNRQVTALAAIRAEMDKAGGQNLDLTKIADAAEEMVYTTQYDYSQSNKPTILQGGWRKVIGQFQQYRLNSLARIGQDIRDSMTGSKEEKATARRALAWTLGMQLALTGAAGSVLAPIAFGIADLFRDDDDLTDSRTDFIRHMPQWLSHGVLANVIDMSRVNGAGLLDFGQGFAPTDASAKDTFNYYVLQNIGPWAGLGAGIASGIEGMMAGDPVKAAKGLAPAGMRDVIKAYFEGQQGAKDSRGITYYDPGIWDTVATAMGLKSGSRAQAEELRGAAYDVDKHQQAMTGRALGMYALAHAQGDAGLLAEAQQRIQDLRQKYPDMRINPVNAIVNRVRQQQNATQFGFATSRPPSQSVKDALGI